MAKLFEKNNSPYWWIDYYQKGVRHRRSTKIPLVDRRKAEKFLDRFRAYQITNPFEIEALNMRRRLPEFKNEYLQYSKCNKADNTYKIDKNSITRFLEYIGNVYITDISQRDIENYKIYRLQFVKRSSVNIDIRHLKAAFNKAVDWEYINVNPFMGIKQLKIDNNIDRRILTIMEINEIRKLIEDEKFLLLIDLLLCTGARRNEILNLTWADLNLEKRHARLIKTKGGFPRTVPLKNSLIVRLKKLDFRERDELIFCYKPDYVTRKFKKLCRKANLPESISLHSLRHTFASILVEQNVDLNVVKELLGHSSINVTQIYSHSTPEHIADAIKKIPI